MALVLAGMGAFLYLRLDRDLDDILNQALSAHADQVAALVQDANSGLVEGARGRSLVEAEESFAQVIDARGTIIDATPLVAGQQLLSEQQLARARVETVLVDRMLPLGFVEPVRLLATPVDAQDQRLVVVVGAALDRKSVV